MTSVVNLTKCPDFNAKRSEYDSDPMRNPNDVYIGRYHSTPKYGRYQLSYWHNPYRVHRRNGRGSVIEMRDGSAAEVMEKYRQYVLGNPCMTFDGKQPKTPPDLLARIHELRGKRLGCWCKPGDCHGDLLAKWADEGIPSHQH